MKASDLKAYEGKVVTLDLINGTQVTTLIKEVSALGDFVTVGDLLVFMTYQSPRNPALPPSPTNPIELKVENMPYGSPLYSVSSGAKIDPAHILFVLNTRPEQIDAYNHKVSGIVPANAAMLDQLKGIDLSGFK